MKLHVSALAASALTLSLASAAFAAESVTDAAGTRYTLQPGHASLQSLLLPKEIPSPADNKLTPERVAAGKALFYDARLFPGGQVSCLSCHFPERGWADGLPTGVAPGGVHFKRATPSLVNVAYTPMLMWDGAVPSLEEHMKGELSSFATADGGEQMRRLQGIAGYQKLFESAYPGEGINATTVAKAVASFQRSIVSRDSPFDRWVQGDAGALTSAQVRGAAVFIDTAKGNCMACHSGPNFTDNSFHNIGLKSAGEHVTDAGRFLVKPVAANRNAFRTPTLRDASLTAPYFHDGSASTLREVVDHYVSGGASKKNLSPGMKPLTLSEAERNDLVAFLQALTTRHDLVDYPVLPR